LALPSGTVENSHKLGVFLNNLTVDIQTKPHTLKAVREFQLITVTVDTEEIIFVTSVAITGQDSATLLSKS